MFTNHFIDVFLQLKHDYMRNYNFQWVPYLSVYLFSRDIESWYCFLSKVTNHKACCDYWMGGALQIMMCFIHATENSIKDWSWHIQNNIGLLKEMAIKNREINSPSEWSGVFRWIWSLDGSWTVWITYHFSLWPVFKSINSLTILLHSNELSKPRWGNFWHMPKANTKQGFLVPPEPSQWLLKHI